MTDEEKEKEEFEFFDRVAVAAMQVLMTQGYTNPKSIAASAYAQAVWMANKREILRTEKKVEF